VHRGQDLLGDVPGLDERDEGERGLALRAENATPHRIPTCARPAPYPLRNLNLPAIGSIAENTVM